MELIDTIVIEEFIQRVKLSNKRRPTYYKQGSKKKIPQKYKGLKFKNGILVHPDGKPVIANPRSVGTPKFKKINGQEIYSGMPHHMRAKIVKEIKQSFIKVLKKHSPITVFPIQLEWEIHLPIGNGDWDLDNLWIYNKCFQDALSESGLIPDDNIQYITKAGAAEFIPVETEAERKMVFKVYHDNREVIQNHPYYEVEKETW